MPSYVLTCRVSLAPLTLPRTAILASPEHPYSRRLIAATPVIPAEWKEPAHAD